MDMYLLLISVPASGVYEDIPSSTGFARLEFLVVRFGISNMFEADFTDGTFGFIDKLLIIFHYQAPFF
jgi:hypothetical protein